MKLIHEPYTKFKGWLRCNGLTYRDVAEMLGLSTTTVSAKINGTSDFLLSEIRTIQKQYRLENEIFFKNHVA